MPHRRLIWACSFGYFALGYVLTTIGPLLPLVREYFSLSHAQISPLFVYQGVGFSLAVLLGGLIGDRVGRKRTLIIGAVALSLGFLAFIFAERWTLALLLFFLAWAAFGLTEGAINAIVYELNRHQGETSLNAVHFFAALGAVVAPFFNTVLFRFGWKGPLVFVGLMNIVFLMWVILVEFPPQESDRQPSGTGLRDISLIVKSPLVIMMAAVLSLYVGAQNGITAWTSSYLIDGLLAPAYFGATATALLWLGIMVGRVLCMRALKTIKPLPLLYVLGVAAAVSYVPVFLFQSLPIALVFTFMTGLFMGGIFPTSLGYASGQFPDRVGSVSGILIASIQIGGASVPALIGLGAEWISLRASLALIVFSFVLMVAFIGAAGRRDGASFHASARRTSPPRAS